jgi:Protein of unknown function (DUF3326)
MLLTEQNICVPSKKDHADALSRIASCVAVSLADNQVPIRIAVTRTDGDGYHCEVGVMTTDDSDAVSRAKGSFHFQKRAYANNASFNAVFLIPTGIGAELGGHSGDAGAAARLLASCCDELITHPNVVNAADINELPSNALYVEGSVVSRLMMGSVGLQKVPSNRVALVVDEHADPFFRDLAINSASAARAALGLDCPLVLNMGDRVTMKAAYSKSGRAAGEIHNLEFLCQALDEHRAEFDAVALSSLINVPEHYHADYFRRDIAGMVNPWGGVEAMLTHALSLLLDVPTAHSPMMTSKEVMELDVGVVDPRKAAEAVSTTYLHCILKGLHRSPRIVPITDMHGTNGLITAADISCLVIPDRCVGLPTLAALEQGITVIAVRENKNCMQNDLVDFPFASGQLIVVDNYLEAAGVMCALRAGVALETVRRPLADTRIVTRRSQTKVDSTTSETSPQTISTPIGVAAPKGTPSV